MEPVASAGPVCLLYIRPAVDYMDRFVTHSVSALARQKHLAYKERKRIGD